MGLPLVWRGLAQGEFVHGGTCKSQSFSEPLRGKESHVYCFSDYIAFGNSAPVTCFFHTANTQGLHAEKFEKVQKES